MNRNHRPRCPPGGGGGGAPPPPPHQPQPPQLNPNFAFQSPNIYFSNPNPDLQLLHNQTNIPLQNPNLLLQNPNLLYHQQFHPNPNALQQQIPTPTQSSPQPQKLKKEVLKKIDRAVLKERNRIIAAGEGVTAWKICQSVTLKLEVDPWSSLGFPMQELPSFRKLMDIETKINAFIHCFVGVRKITTLCDLEEAICENERIGTFEELELGPFLRHQLVVHYFSVNSDVTEVKITNNDIIIFLCKYLDTHKKKDIKIDEFLDFIANKRSLASKEKLGVRIQDLGMHIRFIWGARTSENFFKKKKGKRRSEDDGKLDTSTRMFITIWKEAYKDSTADEVFGRMIQHYKSTYPKKTNSTFKKIEIVALISSVASIKCGMWDSVYDTSQAIGQCELTKDKCSEYENIEAEPSKMAAAVNTEHIVHHTHLEDIMRFCTYFEFDHDDILSKDWSPVKIYLSLLKKLCTCETWLAEQFNVKEFKSLGYGEFFLFLEKHASLLPSELQKLLAGNMCEKSSFEVSLLQHLLFFSFTGFK
ncbi:hypothetical protein LWI28_021547 [Acer negundo]|uniref:Uncharacterized protein n=1 Tax=Acer negundo TaxID=4023 RepID=A0AAD5JKZ4_ACENE|nr:hypothetical protein LWI28_021547 [Acer negundo]